MASRTVNTGFKYISIRENEQEQALLSPVIYDNLSDNIEKLLRDLVFLFLKLFLIVVEFS